MVGWGACLGRPACDILWPAYDILWAASNILWYYLTCLWYSLIFFDLPVIFLNPPGFFGSSRSSSTITKLLRLWVFRLLAKWIWLKRCDDVKGCLKAWERRRWYLASSLVVGPTNHCWSFYMIISTYQCIPQPCRSGKVEEICWIRKGEIILKVPKLFWIHPLWRQMKYTRSSDKYEKGYKIVKWWWWWWWIQHG